jgi:hypothetical protein
VRISKLSLDTKARKASSRFLIGVFARSSSQIVGTSGTALRVSVFRTWQSVLLLSSWSLEMALITAGFIHTNKHISGSMNGKSNRAGSKSLEILFLEHCVSKGVGALLCLLVVEDLGLQHLQRAKLYTLYLTDYPCKLPKRSTLREAASHACSSRTTSVHHETFSTHCFYLPNPQPPI